MQSVTVRALGAAFAGKKSWQARGSETGLRHTSAHVSVSLGQFAVVATSSAATIITARFFGPEGRGALTTLMSATTLAAAVGILGLPTLVLRRRHLDPDVPVAAAAIAAIASTTSACLIIGSFLLVSQHEEMARSGFALWVYLLAVAYALLQILTEGVAAELQAERRFTLLVKARLAWTLLPLMALAGLSASGATPGLAFAAFVIVAIVTSIATVFQVLGRSRISDIAHHLVTEAQGLHGLGSAIARLNNEDIRAAMGTHVSLALLLLIYRLDVVLLAILAGPEQVGLYSIAYAAAEIVWMYVNGVAIVSAPRLVSASLEEARAIMSHELRPGIAVSLMMVASGLLVGPFVISSLLGEAFAPSYLSFFILAPGIVAFVIFKLKATALNARGKSTSLVRLCGFLLVVNIAGNFLLDPSMGANGAAIAASSTYVLGGLLSLRLKL